MIGEIITLPIRFTCGVCGRVNEATAEGTVKEGGLVEFKDIVAPHCSHGGTEP
jgi:hypothetical protein